MSTYDIKQTKTEWNISKDYNYFLQKENSAKAIALIPVTMLFIILLIMGVIGNLLVLYANTFRIKRTTARVYILSLTAFDLTTCLLGLPFNVLTLIYPLTFVWDNACRVLIFLLTFTILGSMFFLDLIAHDRYRKICKPFNQQPTKTKITCWITVIVSAVLALPMCFIYGSTDIDTRIPNVTGKECYISNDYIGSDVSMIYDGFNLLLFVVSVFILGGLYIKVGIVLWKRRHIHDATRNLPKCSASETSTVKTNVSQINTLKDECEISTTDSVHSNKRNRECIAMKPLNSKSGKSHKKHQNLRMADNSQIISEKEKYSKCSMSDLTSVSCDESVSEVRFGKSKFKSIKQIRTTGITAMFFIVTLIFIICFLPFLIISILNSLVENFWNNKSTGEVVIGNMLMRAYFINNMIDPIVYWFLDKQFKQEVHILFRYIRQCDWSKMFQFKTT